MNVILWAAASILAIAFLVSGAAKLFQPPEKLIAAGFQWVEDFSQFKVKLIGAAEILGAAGLIMPPALGILEDLSPVAATGLAVLMSGAVIVHLRRGEKRKIGAPATLAVLTAALALLRFGPFTF